MSENIAVGASHISAIDGDTATVGCDLSDAYVWSNTEDSFGNLYSWEAAKLVCPTGWHLPSDDEWKTLEMCLGMSQSEADDTGARGIDEGNQLKATSGWDNDGNGSNNSGFTALAGGNCSYDGTCSYQDKYGEWWSSTPNKSSNAYVRYLDYSVTTVYRICFTRDYGRSVRCVRY